LEPLDDEVDHIRGPSAGRLILEYGDYECPYSRHAFHQIEIVEKRLDGDIRFAFRHFPLTEIHPHALAASAAAEAASLQGRFLDGGIGRRAGVLSTMTGIDPARWPIVHDVKSDRAWPTPWEIDASCRG
jgi:hypothetical protein